MKSKAVALVALVALGALVAVIALGAAFAHLYSNVFVRLDGECVRHWAQTDTDTQTQTPTDTHRRRHTHTRARARTHTHTHTYTHAQMSVCCPCWIVSPIALACAALCSGAESPLLLLRCAAC